MSSQLILIGLDGADPDFILDHRAEFPFLSDLIARGGMGGLASTLPPFTLTAWSTAMSGMNPGRTGVNCFPPEDFTSSRIEVDSGTVRVARIWDMVSSLKGRAAVLNVPLTFPPSPLNGIMVSGFLAPPGTGKIVWPKDMKGILPDGYRTSLNFAEHRSREEVFRKHLENFTNLQFSLARDILKRESWNLFVFVFSGTDWIQHYYGLKSGSDEDKTAQYFAEIDRRLGELCREHSKADLIVLSDHGFGKVPSRSVALNAWLIREGYLKPTARRGKKRLLPSQDRLRNLGRLPLAGTVRRLLPAAFRGKILRRVRPQAGDIERESSPVHFALFMSHTGYLRIRPGPGGEEERIRLRNELIAKLERLNSEAPGGPIFREIITREEAFPGPHSATFPDLILDFSPEWTGGESLSGKIFSVIPRAARPAPTHRRRGVLIAAGPSFRRGWATEARLEDVVPTICATLGIPLPEKADGRVLGEILLEDRSDQAGKKAYVRTDSESHGWSEEERREVQGRLTALGYLD